mgnify:CR=1 FL=1|jgi:nitrogen regulatory protein P-II 1
MIQREITVLTDIVLITCIVQRGVADDIIQAAREAGAQREPPFILLAAWA